MTTQPAIREMLAGYPLMDVSYSNVTNSCTYDALARPVTLTDGRGNTTLTVYDAVGQIAYTEDGAANRTTYAYDMLGQRISTTDPLGNTIHSTYDAAGNLISQWGATYPVLYDYDTQGRMVSMATTRDSTNWDTTQWLYDNATGLLTNKLYATGHGTSYSYYPNVKLATRTWARGVTTDYTYDNLGQLTTINYSDPTPDVTFAYDRLGRHLSAIVDGIATNVFSYSGLDLTAESQNGGTINRITDNYGRSAGISLADSPYSIGYGYDAYGRFSSVTSHWPLATSHFSYSYLANSDLIAGYKQGDFTRTIAYEPTRNLIASIENRFGTALVSSFDYQNNAAGQRTQRIDNGTIINSFDYNIRREVTNATMGVNSYGYGYDTIGNREWASLNLATNLYAANVLNQYTSISAPSASPREPQYDLDGNMLYDGEEWNYTWNGENRLVLASNATHVVEYAYDHHGRMATKNVTLLANSQTEAAQYLWDGYNIIAEKVGRTVPGEPPTTIATTFNIWGLDLSGTLQGAGGVGGLLSVTRDGAAFLPCYDANSNITEYITPAGTTVAHYQYSPFGEIASQSGSLASTFTHRFSTKPWCAVTELSEYEMRMYHPKMGRWLSRDPVQESGGVNIYLLINNDAENNIDILGLRGSGSGLLKRCCYCGPEISKGLVATLNAVENEYKSLITSNPKKAIDICKANHLSGTWDILFPSSPSGCGDGAPCNETYRVNGKCYNKWDINYVLFGKISSLCEFSRLKMELMIAGHKMLVKTYLQAIGPEKFKWEYTSQVRGWSRTGRAFSGDFSGSLPIENKGYLECKKCDKKGAENEKYSSVFGTTWP